MKPSEIYQTPVHPESGYENPVKYGYQEIQIP
jgi:hypothetical protein